MELTNEDVAEILALLDSLPYDELDLQTTRFRLTLRRTPAGWTEQSQLLAEPATIAPALLAPGGRPPGEPPHGGAARPSIPPRPASPQPPATSAGDGDDERTSMVAVAAPLPGTFYRAPRPGAVPFVEVGDEVAEDTVVAIVETMKLMNSVHAGTRGRVARICLENAEPAAQGATLMWIEPAT